jgi:hypothetical protein
MNQLAALDVDSVLNHPTDNLICHAQDMACRSLTDPAWLAEKDCILPKTVQKLSKPDSSQWLITDPNQKTKSRRNSCCYFALFYFR